MDAKIFLRLVVNIPESLSNKDYGNKKQENKRTD